MISLQHTLREGNHATDFLTTKGSLSDNSLVILCSEQTEEFT